MGKFWRKKHSSSPDSGGHWFIINPARRNAQYNLISTVPSEIYGTPRKPAWVRVTAENLFGIRNIIRRSGPRSRSRVLPFPSRAVTNQVNSENVRIKILRGRHPIYFFFRGAPHNRTPFLRDSHYKRAFSV